MAKKIKFPLVMKNGIKVRSLEELKMNFDACKVIALFMSGKLKKWLEINNYNEQAKRVDEIDIDDGELLEKICKILDVDYNSDADYCLEVIKQQERLRRLVRYTKESDILERCEQVAFNQKELDNLLMNNADVIYLCDNAFVIPLNKYDKSYIGIGKVMVSFAGDEKIDFGAMRISFDNVSYDGLCFSNCIETDEDIYQKGVNAENAGEYTLAWECYDKLSKKGHMRSCFKKGWFYNKGLVVERNYEEAYKWYKKAADLGYEYAMLNIGVFYEYGLGVEKDETEAIEWYKKASEFNYAIAMRYIAMIYAAKSSLGTNACEYAKLAHKWYTKAAELNDDFSSIILARFYAPHHNYYIWPSYCNIDDKYSFANSIEYTIGYIKDFFGGDLSLSHNYMEKAAKNKNIPAIYALINCEKLALDKRIEWGVKGVELGDEECICSFIHICRVNEVNDVNVINMAIRYCERLIEKEDDPSYHRYCLEKLREKSIILTG